jgi:GH35 family endo-1,4-beta-xylanase
MLSSCVVPLLIAACSSGNDSRGAEGAVGQAQEAITGADCGFTVTSKVHGVGKKGFQVQVKVSNVSGATSTGFSVLVQAGQAQLVNVAHGSFQPTDNGYLLLADDSLADAQLDPGQTYTFELKFEGEYTSFTPVLMSSNGSKCDQEAPTVSLTTNRNFFGTEGTLSLTASAADNVAVAKVEFLQDGAPIGIATAAPYTVNVPISGSMNGRHIYSAIAYDLAGNSATQAAGRVLVSIQHKFFGTAVTAAADYTGFAAHFNQVTPGNAGKWGSVQPNGPDQWNWSELDTAYQFAKANNVPFKFHTLVWGQQQPGWVSALAAADQLAAIENWMAAVAARYPQIDLIDVVNEPLHAVPSYKEALGGAGATGWDWVINAFQMARKHFPNAELIINDYSVIQDQESTASFLAIVKLLNDRGLIDGIGEQAHFYERWPAISVLETNLQSLASTGLPLYVSELDVSDPNDSCQAARLGELFKLFWDNPSVIGVTHWGFLKGTMWRKDAWLVDGTAPRQSLNWVESYRAGGSGTPVVCVPSHVGDATSITLEPELYDTMSGLRPVGDAVGYAGSGSWFGFKGVVFNGNWNKVTLNYAKPGTDPVTMTIHLDSPDSPSVATIALGDSGAWWTFKTADGAWAPIGGAHDVYIRYNGGGGNIESVKFTGPTETGPNLLPNSDFETTDAYGWQNKPWGGSVGTVARTTSRAYTGVASLAQTGRTAAGGIWLWLGGTISGGKTYKVSLWSTIGGAAAAGAHVTTMTQCTGGSETYLPLGGSWGDKTLTNGNWTEFSGDLVVPNCQLAGAWMLLEGPAAGVDLYLDHASIRQVLVTNPNLLPNGGFESGIDGWSGSGATASVGGTLVHGGAVSLMGVATSPTGYPNLVRDLMAVVKPGKKYQVSVWFSGGSNSAYAGLTNNFGCSGFSAFSSVASASVGANVWGQVSGTLDFTSCPNSLWWAQLWVGGGQGATYYIDDVQLTEKQ